MAPTAEETDLRALVDDAPAGMIWFDASGRVTFASRRATALVGRELVGLEAAADFPDLPAFADAVGAALKGVSQSARVEGVSFEARVLPSGTGAFAVLTERTEPLAGQDAESQLRFLDTLIETIPLMIFVKASKDLRFVRVNRAAEDIMGFSREALLGRGDYDFFPEEEADFFTGKDRQVLREGLKVDVPEESLHTPHRGVRILHTIKVPVHDAEGHPLYLLGVSEDVTEVTAQRRELALRLQELDHLRTQLVTNVSHELRTPLALILARIDRLLERAPRPDDRADVVGIERAATTLTALVNDLFDITRLEAGRLLADYSRVDLARLVRTAASSFEVLAETRGTRLVVETPPTLLAEVDAPKVQRIVENLLANALRHTPTGVVRVSVGTRADRITIEVADSGPGVPSHLRERVFERFFQARSQPAGGGAGLGLALVREYARLHDGTARVEEAPEGGAAFVVELPARAREGTRVREGTAEAGLTPTPRPSIASAPVEQRRGDRALVLVVEDHAEMAAVLLETLGARFDVAWAEDGEAGLARALELRPDLVLTDLMMPRMTGEQLLAEMRRRPELEGVPAIVLTARGDDDTRIRLLRGGAQDYVSKPFSAPEIVARVENLVSLRRAGEVLRGELRSSRRDVEGLARELSRRARGLRLLSDVGALAASSLDEQQILDAVARRVVPELAAGCVVDRIDDDGSSRRVVALGTTPLPEHPLAAERRAVRVTVEGHDAIVAPLAARGRTLGSLLLVDPVERGRDGLELAEEVARRIGLAVENALLLQATREAVRARDDFLAVASHELRTPLTPLVLTLQSMLRTPTGQPADAEALGRLAALALGHCRRMTRLVNELLDVTRIQAGHLELALAPADLLEVVERTVTELRPMLDQSGCAVTVTAPDAVPGTWDASRLQQVVTNLLTNAARFGARSPIEIEISTTGDAARLSVRDHGVGIPADQVDRIFERFHRAHSTRHYGGLGLGLYICRHIVQAHGGTLEVASRVGEGATFTISLPVGT